MSEQDLVAKTPYPWDKCIADQKARGHSDDSAAKICAYIKNKSQGIASIAAESVTLEAVLADMATAAEALKVVSEGRVLSNTNLKTLQEQAGVLKKAYLSLTEVIRRGQRLTTAALEMTADGLEIIEALEVPNLLSGSTVVLDENGVGLEAGERVGTMIKKARLAMGLNHEQMADHAGVSMPVYDQIESGQINRPPEDVLRKIATKLNMNPDMMLKASEYDAMHPIYRY